LRDLNDRFLDGDLPPDPMANAEPMNEKAKREQENAPMQKLTVRELLSDSAERAANPTRIKTACTTTHAELDDWTGGIRKGFVWVLGADTSWGKSSWAIAVADDNIKAGRRVMIVSVEDPPELYGDRLMARRARVSAYRLMKGMSTPAELASIRAVQANAEDVPVYVFAGAKPVERVVVELQSIIRGEGIDLVFFDYLQEFATNKRHQDERTRFKHTSSVMRNVIRSNDRAGVILSQLTIADPTKPPSKHMIRESRDVSNAAEVVALGFSPETTIYKKTERNEGGQELGREPLFVEGSKYILLDKNKGGPPKKWAKMKWSEDSACFDTVLDRDNPPPWAHDEDFQNGLGDHNGYE